MSSRNTETLHTYIMGLAARIEEAEQAYAAQIDAIRSMLINGVAATGFSGITPGHAHSITFDQQTPTVILSEKDKAIIRAYAAGEDILVMLLGRD